MSYRIEIVPAGVWRKEVQASFSTPGERLQRLAWAALRTLHDRHIGLTLPLALDLARLLDGPSRPAGRPRRDDGGTTGPWGSALDCLRQALTDGREKRRRPGWDAEKGLQVHVSPFYVVARIAAPLLAAACAKLDLCFLFGADEGSTAAGFAGRYRRYQGDLKTALEQAIEERSQLFWQECAFTLATLSRPSATAKGPAGVPRLEPVGTALLMRLEPQPRATSRPRPLRRRLETSPRFRPMQHRNEGGIDGIHRTRRLDDLPAMLKSELILPDVLLLDRLTHSGYLALRRPPLREKRRDVLVAGLLPALPPMGSRPGAAVTTALVKASWVDTMLRLARWLLVVGLRKSEFLWIEGDAHGRFRESRFLLDEVPGVAPMAGDSQIAYRTEMLSRLDWLPGWLDAHGAYRWPAAMPAAVGEDPLTDLLDWSRAAWSSQEDHRRWLRRESAGRPPAHTPALDLDAYGVVHLMLFLPAALADDAHPMGALRRRFELGLERGREISVTWVPAVLADRGAETGWNLTRTRGRPRPLAGPAIDLESRARLEHALAGELVGAWSELLLRELLDD